MISVAEADKLLAGLLPPPAAELVPLERAVGRVLARDLDADRDGPPYDRVAMDGYAVSSGEGLRSWTVRGAQFAGAPPVLREERAAVEVATGAVLPRNCDAVVPYEQTVRTDGTVALLPEAGLTAGQHVHRAGSDFRRGDRLLAAGTRLLSPHLHILASAGVDPVAVIRRMTWSLAATGDELVEVSAVPEPWQIRRSNAAAIAGEARAWGLAPREQVLLPDDRGRLRSGIERLLADLDLLVLTGGVSAGRLDLVPSVLNELGCRTVFHKINQRPGKPLWCGVLPGPRPVAVLGLPGNPVSSLFAFRRYALPWLLAAEGRPWRAQRVSAEGLRIPPEGQTVFLPWSESEGLLAAQGSGNFFSLAASTGFIEVKGDDALAQPLYYPWGGWT